MSTAAPIHSEISHNVRAALAFWGIGRGTLADWLNVKRNHAYRLTSGTRAWSLDHLQIIADHLQVSVSLLTGPTSELMKELGRQSDDPDFCRPVSSAPDDESQNLKVLILSHPQPAMTCAA